MLVPRQKIIWAVNPNKNPNEARELIKEMKTWAKKLDCDIQPVAVFSKLKTGFPIQMNLLWDDSFEKFAKVSLEKYLKKLPTDRFLEPEVLFSNSLSNRNLASELSAYAGKAKAALIFANTHVKKTNNPFRLGGFAETLITLAETPVILMNPSVESKSKKNSILFPTNFGSDSERALTKIKPWVTALQSQLILFNQIEFPDAYTYDFQSSKVINVLKETETLRRDVLHKMSEELAKDQIKSIGIVARSHKYLGAQIIEVARKNKVELIVITNSAGPLQQAILGSVARDILTQARCPVLVLNHRQLEKSTVQSKSALRSQSSLHNPSKAITAQ